MWRAINVLAITTSVLVLGASCLLGWRLWASLPQLDGTILLSGLQHRVVVNFDRFGIPVIEADSRRDAFHALGFLHARDRLFQMDLGRRRSLGRLAELFGERAVAADRQQRAYQAERAAAAVLRALPASQRDVLEAYTAGVNAYMRTRAEWPFEMIVLRYDPEPWRPEDSLLVAFGMFQTLTSQERDERMLTVMHQQLPPELIAFLTPDTDSYTSVLLGGPDSRRPPRATPVHAIAEVLRSDRRLKLSARVDPDVGILGSNEWAVAGKKTADGRAIVANDMHLNLSVPNTWYRAEIRYARAQLAGVTLPGLPLMVAGSNGHVAWGFTNVDSDVADLVRLEVNPARPDQYRTPGGWQDFMRSVETIQVRDGAPVALQIRSTVWGPVLETPLLGQPVAIRWTALDPDALNLELLDMDRAENLDQAIAVMNQAGIPPQNVALADRQGHIAWTYAGFFPKRRGFDGSVSASWADGDKAWEGFIPPEELPRLIDPPDGFLATANNRTLGAGYPHVVGHNFSHSYRAYRISQRLTAMENVTEEDLLGLQLDTESQFFEFYRRLVLELAAGQGEDPDLREAKAAAESWNGRLDAESKGIPLLVEYRKQLMKLVFGPLLGRCQRADEQFSYGWRESETPLRALLSERSALTLPSASFPTWDDFLRNGLKATVRRLKAEYDGRPLQDLAWGTVNLVTVHHPFGKMLPWLSPILDMPEVRSAGCSGHCIRVVSADKGASERFVISPAHHPDGILHMPGGQSGHPWSPHYGDQQQAWAQGRSLPFSAGASKHTLRLEPSAVSR